MQKPLAELGDGRHRQIVLDDMVLVRQGRLKLLHDIAAIARADSLAGDISDDLSTALDALDDFDDRPRKEFPR